MQKRLAAMVLPLAGLCLLTAATPASACWRSGPPAVGAGTRHLTTLTPTKGKDAAPKSSPQQSS